MGLFTPNCGNCRLRQHQDGGNGRCPHGPTVRRLYEKRSEGGRDNDCARFVPGERRAKPVATELPEDGLF